MSDTNSNREASPSNSYAVPPYTGPSQSVSTPAIQTIPGTSEYPFTINLRNAVPGINTEDTITLRNVRELSDSVQSETWDTDTPQNTFAVPNDDDTLTYKPKGTYFRNALIVEMEVIPAALPGQPPPNGEEEEAQTVEVVVPIEKNIVGNTEAHKTMWQTQGSNGTCAGMAVGAVLKSKGIVSDEWQVVIDGTLVIGPDGTHLNTPAFRDADGAPPFVVQLTTQAELKRYRTEGIKWIGKIVSGHELAPEGWGESPNEAYHNYRALYPVSTRIVPNAGQIDNVPGYYYGTKTRWTESFFSHYGQQGRFGMATDFATIIAELQHGNPVILRVDGSELRGTPADRFNTIMDDNDRTAAHVQSNGNHVIWLTSIDNTDPDNPVFNVIDSASPGGARQYNLREITAAAEDTEFAYITIGTKPPLLIATDNFEYLTSAIDPAYSNWWKGAYRAAQHHEHRERRDEVPPPAITNEQAKAITGKDSVAEAWAEIYRIPLRNLGDYPAIFDALPREAPFTTLSTMIENLNIAKRKVYTTLRFDNTALENLKTSVDIE